MHKISSLHKQRDIRVTWKIRTKFNILWDIWLAGMYVNLTLGCEAWVKECTLYGYITYLLASLVGGSGLGIQVGNVPHLTSPFPP